MSIDRAYFDAVAEQDLQELVQAQVPEGLHLEYKRGTYGSSDAEKRECLKDISAFANAQGGHLILGIEEVEGVARSIEGINAATGDQELLRLEQIVRNGLEPRVSGIRMKAVPLGNDRIAVIVRVPRSWNPPHRVVAQGANRFYVRHSAGVHEPNVEELRALFTQSAAALDAAREFRADRLARIQNGDVHPPLVAEGRIVLHLVPVAAFSRAVSIDIQTAHANHTSFHPIGAFGIPRYNYHGFINERGGQENDGYTQIFRNGILEATKARIVRTFEGQPSIPGLGIEGNIFQVFHNYVAGLRELNVPPPLIFMLTLEGVVGARYVVRNNIWGEYQPLPHDVITLPECVIEDYGTTMDHHRAVKPAFDALWNAAGYPEAQSFNDDGQWIGDRP